MALHFSDPKNNVLQFGLREGMKVGDFGAGTGHYALVAAGVVGPEGKIYAVDIQEDLLRHIRETAKDRNFYNIETIWGDFEKVGGTTLRDHTLDAVMLSNVLFQLDQKDSALAEIKRVLKPGGKLLVVDWAGAYEGLGPDADRVVPESEAEELFITGGFHKVKDFRAGPHHYSIVFTAP